MPGFGPDFPLGSRAHWGLCKNLLRYHILFLLSTTFLQPAGSASGLAKPPGRQSFGGGCTTQLCDLLPKAPGTASHHTTGTYPHRQFVQSLSDLALMTTPAMPCTLCHKAFQSFLPTRCLNCRRKHSPFNLLSRGGRHTPPHTLGSSLLPFWFHYIFPEIE